MPTDITNLFQSFESHCFEHEGSDAWRARDIMPGLGYAKWQTFREAIKRAWASCARAGIDPAANFRLGDGSLAWTPDEVFTEASKNPQGGRPSEDVILTRRAAYLVAMNGDPTKPEIAFAQQYFAASTRTFEVVQAKMHEASRLEAREKLTATEKRFQGVLFEHDVDGPGIGRIRCSGDRVLFGGKDTEDMKVKWGVPAKRPLADFAPKVLVSAKEFSAAITAHNVATNNLNGEFVIGREHDTNNDSVRSTLLSRGIIPEESVPEEDIKKVERRHASEAKKLTAPPKTKKPNKVVTATTPLAPPALQSTKRVKPPTVKEMVDWFRSTHERAVDSSTHDSSEGGWMYPLAEVDVDLYGKFPHATDGAIGAALLELDEDGPWLDVKFTEALEDDRRNDPDV